MAPQKKGKTMTKDRDQASENSNAENKAETAKEKKTPQAPIEINSVEDIVSLVNNLESNQETGAALRSYTVKGGFKALDPLIGTHPHVLAFMSGCINYALSMQATEGTEGAKEVFDISLEYAKNVGSLTENTTKLNNYCKVALNLGFGDGADFEDLSQKEKAIIVTEFLGAQSKKPDESFMKWTKEASV